MGMGCSNGVVKSPPMTNRCNHADDVAAGALAAAVAAARLCCDV